MVIRQKGGNGGEQSGRCVDERLADAGRHGDDGRCSHRTDVGKRIHDSPHGSEQADEWRRRCRRGEESKIADLYKLDKQQIAWRRAKIAQLGNADFVSRAPAEKVEELRARVSDIAERSSSLDQMLEALS